ncbi:calponin homology domain-containing protein DDB_G0272472 isoform X2 [Eurosta solidaginis]|uniref:calponin homology domain-containing protein DDB_G0272472 isoform X2 n=1 Tax=Eurosta solidaginis TaxID=178769 RepID=UPI003530B103
MVSTRSFGALCVNEDFHQSKENEERKRNEKLAKAQNLIEQLKPGPKQLQSAAMQSEVLRARNVQRNINKEFEKAVKRQECMDALACEHQALAFIQEDQQRQQERQQNMNAYKRDVFKSMTETCRQRIEQKKLQIREERAAREAMDQEIKAQIEKEKAIMEKKRAALRKNALEAMKMVEQRRLRERMTEEIEDRLCAVYNLGKQDIDAAKKEEETKKPTAEDQTKQEMQAQFLSCVQAKYEAAEDDRIRRDISRMQLKFTAEEQEKIRKDKAAKQARIEAYMRELQQQKEAKRRAEEEKRYEMATRFKNSELNRLFEEAQKQKGLNQIKENRITIKEQIENKLRMEEEDKELMRMACQNNDDEREDKFFFEYARNLMEDAHKKQRPLYPFVKVVEQYKRDRGIDCERKTPKHLLSHINIGTCQPGDSQADAAESTLNKHKTAKSAHAGSPTECSNSAAVAAKMEKSDKESILENCLKISELIAADAKKSENDGDICKNKLVDCLRPSSHFSAAKKEDDCELLLSAGSKVRYSMTDLKKMNQFKMANEQ